MSDDILVSTDTLEAIVVFDEATAIEFNTWIHTNHYRMIYETQAAAMSFLQ